MEAGPFISLMRARNLYKETLSNGQYIQTTIGSGFFSVAVDGNGGLYAGGNGINGVMGVYKEIPSNGQYTQTELGNGFGFPTSLAVDGRGNVYIADRGHTNPNYPIAIYKIDLADPPTLTFAATPSGATSSDSPQTIAVANIGNVGWHSQFL